MFRKTLTGVSVTIAALCASPVFAQSHGTHVTTVSHPQPSTHASSPSHLTFIQRIDANPQLMARLQPLVPSGMTLDQAAAGFKNQGQFIAALHASKNLNIPFDQLKAEMTGADHDSLGKAIHDLKPGADTKTEVEKAEQEAKTDVKTTRPTTTTTTKDADNDTDAKK